MSGTPGTVLRRVRRAGAMAGAMLLLAGCAPSSVVPGDDRPAAVEPVALEDFARTNGLAALPRARVVIGAGEAALAVDVLVADTEATRARGLQGVGDVPQGLGMLFTFDGPAGAGGRPGFWMLDTLVPLDIAFVADGAVVGVATMSPCTTRPCPVTHPGVAYDAALEVAAGVLADARIVVGAPFVRQDDVAG